MTEGSLVVAHTPRGAKTRNKLIDAARELLVEGDGDLAFAEVAARAGVSPGAPYRYFVSKSALVVAVVESVFDELEKAAYMPTFEHEAPTWIERERIRIERLADFFFESQLARLMLRGIAGDGAVAQARAHRLDRQTRGAAKNLAVGKRAKVVPADVDPQIAAPLLIGGIYQLLATAAKPKSGVSRRKLKTELWTFFTRVLAIRTWGPSDG